ncbi:MAG: Flp family type IVb pilin [Nitrosomonas sp.]|nr:Flp family type IVb pilin [Nitrosomonas sp.]
MEKLVKQVKHFWNDEAGATAVEYGLMVALIAVGIIIAVTGVRDALIGLFNQVSAAL